jgi:hypothetical protein
MKSKIRPCPARYPVELPLRYKAVSAETAAFGVGRTSFMGSLELLFAGDQPLEPGMKAEIWIAWPVLLDGRVRLQLVVEGKVVGIQDGLNVVSILKHHYRTRGTSEQSENGQRMLAVMPALESSQTAADARSGRIDW